MLVPKDKKERLNAARKQSATGISNVYDVVFILNINSKGWILEKICKVIARQSGLRTRIIFTERNNTVSGWLPTARSYFFSHYKIYMGALNSGVLPADSKTYVWFTHPSFSGGNTVEAFVSALNQATLIITANSFHAQALAFLGIQTEKLKTILGGADPDQFRPKPREARAVGIVGAYYERKNPDLLLEVVRAMPDVAFLLVAPHPSEVENKSLLWENWKKFPELRELPNFNYVAARFEEFGDQYGRFDVYLSLSNLEGGPIPLLEAMFANCYPVVTRTGFAEDIVTDGANGILLPLFPSVEQVSNAIRSALHDRTTDVAATVADYSWDAFGLNFRDALDPPITTETPVSFALEESRLNYLREGWGDQDPTGVWLAMRAGSIRIRLHPDSKAIAILFIAQPALGMDAVPLRISLNGQVVDEALFEGGPHTREVPLTIEDFDGVLWVTIELTSPRIESLGTICIESVAAMTREAVVANPDAAGVVQSTWGTEEGYQGPPLFDVPVVLLGAQGRTASRPMRRALHANLGIPTLPEDGQLEAEWDGIAIADGVPAERIHGLSQVDGVVARTVNEELSLVRAAPNLPVVVIPELIRGPITAIVRASEPSIRRAVLFTQTPDFPGSGDSWISEVLNSKGIKATSSDAVAVLRTGDLSGARSRAATAAETADLCIFAGAEDELPLISTCLSLGVPVLISGPSALHPALAAHGLRHAFLQNTSRLAKTLTMIEEPRARRSLVQQFEQLLESGRGLEAATERYARFARGLIDQRRLARRRPKIGIICLAPYGEEDSGYSNAVISSVLDLSCEVSVLCASDESAIAVSHPNLSVTFVGQEPGSNFAWDPAAAQLRISTFAGEHRPDLFLCFSETAQSLVKGSATATPVVRVAGSNMAESDARSATTIATPSLLKMPRLMPAKLTSKMVAALGRDRAAARKDLGFRSDETIMFCLAEGPRNEDQVPNLALALETARETGNRVRVVFAADSDQAGGSIFDRLRKKAAGPRTVELSYLGNSDQVDLAMRAADFALIAAPPADATLFSRALAFGLPILARSDVAGADLLGPRVCGATYDVANRSEFEDNLKAFLADVPLRKKLSAQAEATFAGLPSYDEIRLSCATVIAEALQ